MKRKFAATAITLALASPQVFAQAKNFEGFSVLGGLNVATASVDSLLLQPDPKKGRLFDNYQAQSTKTNGGLEAQYAAAFGEKFVLAAGVNVGLGDLSFGDPKYGQSGEIKLKQATSVFVKPGYAISDSTLVFAKLASIQGTASWRSSDDRLSGRGFGLGAQMRSGKNVYYQLEWNRNRYDDLVLQNGVEQFSSNVLTLGVGYKF